MQSVPTEHSERDRGRGYENKSETLVRAPSNHANDQPSKSIASLEVNASDHEKSGCVFLAAHALLVTSATPHRFFPRVPARAQAGVMQDFMHGAVSRRWGSD